MHVGIVTSYVLCMCTHAHVCVCMCASVLMERVVDPGSRTTTEEQDRISRFEGNIPPANGTGVHRARRVFDQRSQPPHCTGLSGDPKA